VGINRGSCELNYYSVTGFNDWLIFVCYSLTVCQFAARGDMEWFVVVGTARDLILNPRSCSGGCLLLYRLAPDGSSMEFVHMVSHRNEVIYCHTLRQ